MPNIKIPDNHLAQVQMDQAGIVNVNLPAVYAIHDTRLIDAEQVYFQCTTRVVRLVRPGFPWIKIYNENLLIWLEQEFIQTAQGYWKLRRPPRGKTGHNMIYHFYAEKIL